MQSWFQRCLGSFTAACLCSGAFAQLQPTGPFTGNQSEGFEGPQVIFTPCIASRVFNNNGDLCTPGNSGCHTTTGWSYFCTIYPNGGQYFYGSAGGATEITFDQPATRFGGWFGSNSNVPDATFEFFDANNSLIASVLGVVPADCGWHWLGWQASGAQQIKRVLVTSLGSSGGYLDMDDLQAEFGVPPPVTYCTAKVNSLGCTPSIAFTGAPDHTGATSFNITASNFLGTLPGHLFYSVGGPANLPFKGGTMCIAQPIRRTAMQMSGGALNTCAGVYQLDFNAYCVSGANPALTPGTTVWAQYWGYDPGFAVPNRASLSNAIRFSM